jgi:DNA-binding NtrC family response regulator
MAGVVSTSYRVIECHPERRRDVQSVVDAWRFAIASGSPVVALHVDQLEDEVRGLVRNIVRSANQPTRLFLTAHHLPLDLVSGLALAGPREIKMPPLRSRRDDIPALVAHFLASDAALTGLKVSGKLLGALARADWPGNVADLRDVILSASEPAQAGILCISDLGEMQRGALARGRLTRLEAGELEQIRHALAEARGNRVRAAQILEIGRSTLYRKIDSYSRRGFDLGG